MTTNPERDVNKWIEKAEHDILTVQTIIEYQPLVLDTACFHCQQAAEKYLKAFLVFKKQEIIKTHAIDFLIKQCAKFDSEFKDINIKDIQIFAIDARYPDDSIEPTMEETNEYLQIVNEIKALVLEKIKE